ncbi:hypothetical protein [Aeoliella sp.]|uniref:hypothetical protein n=1 Tax=Aeoliella sp. TaxID=2795800 RepID=UPI003CCC32D7
MPSDNRSHALLLLLAVVVAFGAGVLVSQRGGETSGQRETLPREAVVTPQFHGQLSPKPADEGSKRLRVHVQPLGDLLFPFDVERAMLIEAVEESTTGLD